MSQNDFISRLGQWVLRKDPIGEERAYQLFKPEDPSKEYRVAQFYMALQEQGITFRPLLRVTNTNNTCVSCEG